MLDTVVVVEDEKPVGDMLKYLLESNNYNVEHYATAEHFLAMRTHHNHAIYIVDLNLPGMKGTDIVKTIRTVDKVSPVFMLSGHKEESDVSLGLTCGADDYLFKPFHPDHLLLKLNNARSKTETILKDMLTVGLKVLPEAHAIVNNGITVNFTPKEFSIFYPLYKNLDRIVSRESLAQEGFEDVIARNVDVQVFSIRKKLEKVGLEIETVRGKGYRLMSQKNS